MYLNDIRVWASEEIVERFKGGFVGRFHHESACVVEYYLKHLWQKVENDQVERVYFVFADTRIGPPTQSEIERIDIIKWERVVPIIVRIPWPFDFATYINAEAPTKKRMILDALHAAMLWTATYFGWNHEPFIAAYEAILQKNMIVDGLLKPSWASPCEKWRVRVYFEYDIDAVRFTAILFKNRSKKEVARKFLGKGIPGYGCLFQSVRDGKWTSKTEFALRVGAYFQKQHSVDFSDVMNSNLKVEIPL